MTVKAHGGITPRNRKPRPKSLRSQRSEDELTLREEVRKRRRKANRANKLNEIKTNEANRGPIEASAGQTRGHVEPPGPAKKDKTAVGIALRATGTHKLTDAEKRARARRRARKAAGEGEKQQKRRVKQLVRREERRG